MRVLFVAAGSAATVFAMAPLATAARNAGHQVIMAANDDMIGVITGSGLPAVSVCTLPISHFIYTDRTGQPVSIPADAAEQTLFTGRWFGRMAAAWLRPLRSLAQAWRPDLVVGGTMCYAASLLARHLGIPHVRQAWDAIEATGIDRGADEELRPELAELGLDNLPEPDLFVDVCPPSLLPPTPHPARRTQPMRWISASGQRQLEPWMYTSGERPRVCLTAGSRVADGEAEQDFRRRSYEFLRSLAVAFLSLGADLVIAAPETVAASLRAELPEVRAGWIPLDVLAPTCGVIAHHGGGVTSMTAVSAGLPQVIIPQGAVLVPPARRLAGFGAAVTLAADPSAQAVADACGQVLDDPWHRKRAVELSAEVAGLPPPADVVAALEDLV